jgi:hypothetical protein
MPAPAVRHHRYWSISFCPQDSAPAARLAKMSRALWGHRFLAPEFGSLGTASCDQGDYSFCRCHGRPAASTESQRGSALLNS